MALGATVYKAGLQVSDLDRGHFGTHALTLARHPSETDERMMVRLLAFALNADERLAFGRGLSEADDPDLCQTGLTGVIEHWIEVGQPDEKRLLRSCGRAARVSVYCYSASAEIWWRPLAAPLRRARNLAVWRIPHEQSRALAALAQRGMQLQCTVQESTIWIGTAEVTVELRPERLLPVEPD